MNTKIDENRCKYLQIAEQMKLDIFNDLQGNAPLPTIRNSADKYHVNANTIAKAFKLLKEQRIIYSHRTTGYYVVPNIKERKQEFVFSLIDDLLICLENIGYTKADLLFFLEEEFYDRT